MKIIARLVTLFYAFVLSIGLAEAGDPTWTVSYSAANANGVQGAGIDPNSNWIGALQGRGLVAHYYANGVTMPSGVTCNSSNATWISAQSQCAGILLSTGQYSDIWGPEGPQYAQILALDKPGGCGIGGKYDCWYLDTSLSGSGAWIAGGTNRAFIGALRDHAWTTDCSGNPISPPQPMVMLGAQGSNASILGVRYDPTHSWSFITVATGSNQQLRSLGNAVDPTTGIDTLYAGEDANGLYNFCLTAAGSSGLTNNGLIKFCSVYNSVSQTCTTLCSPSTVNNCTNTDPQWLGGSTVCTAAGVPVSQCQNCSGDFDLMPCDGGALGSWRAMQINTAYSSALGRNVTCETLMLQIWCLHPGTVSSQFLYELAQVPLANIPSSSQSGFRGLIPIPNLAGTGQDFLVTTEGNIPNVYRVNVATGAVTSLAPLGTLYGTYCGLSLTTSYRIDAYDKFLPVNNSYIFGEGTTFMPQGVGSAACPSINWAGTTFGASNSFLNQRSGYWVLTGLGTTNTFTFHRIPPIMPQFMIGTYDEVASPFPQDAGKNCVYFTGMDPNTGYQHRTAWAIKGCGLPIP